MDPTVFRSAIREGINANRNNAQKWGPLYEWFSRHLNVTGGGPGTEVAAKLLTQAKQLDNRIQKELAQYNPKYVLLVRLPEIDEQVVIKKLSQANLPRAQCAMILEADRPTNLIVYEEDAVSKALVGMFPLMKVKNQPRLAAATPEITLPDKGQEPEPSNPQLGDRELQPIFEQILELQLSYTHTNNQQMQERGQLIRRDGPEVIRSWLESDMFNVEGSDGTGSKTKVPWIRVYSEHHSPKATEGWYIVYLFSFDGSVVYLSLNQGATDPVKAPSSVHFVQKDAEFLEKRVLAARNVLSEDLNAPPGLSNEMHLRDDGPLARAYEAGNVCSYVYSKASIPHDAQLRQDLESLIPILEKLQQFELESEVLPPMPPPTPSQDPDPQIDLDWLLHRTLWEQDDLEEIIDTLENRRPQVVLAGPPGTGKTWAAEHLARFLTGDRPGAHRVVQFHPTYGYEDFVEGLRPVESDGNVVFDVIEGALIDMAEQARSLDHPVVLVIDEMNRANLPSVFGELLYLLEYRNREIRLLHRENFSLPENLFIIGTMNTADRSIRSIDTALRRRFDIFECQPEARVLEAFYDRDENETSFPGLAKGMKSLNDQLAEYLDRHHAVGHTFFMGETFSGSDLERVWKRQILPLIEEYFFDQPDIVETFTLQNLWPDANKA